MIGRSEKILESLVVHGETLHQIFVQARCGPQAKLRASVAAHTKTDGQGSTYFSLRVCLLAGFHFHTEAIFMLTKPRFCTHEPVVMLTKWPFRVHDTDTCTRNPVFLCMFICCFSSSVHQPHVITGKARYSSNSYLYPVFA